MKGEKISAKISVPEGETVEIWWDNSEWPNLYFSLMVPSWHWLAAAAKYSAGTETPLALQVMETAGAFYWTRVLEISEEDQKTFIKLIWLREGLNNGL